MGAPMQKGRPESNSCPLPEAGVAFGLQLGVAFGLQPGAVGVTFGLTAGKPGAPETRHSHHLSGCGCEI